MVPTQKEIENVTLERNDDAAAKSLENLLAYQY